MVAQRLDLANLMAPESIVHVCINSPYGPASPSLSFPPKRHSETQKRIIVVSEAYTSYRLVQARTSVAALAAGLFRESKFSKERDTYKPNRSERRTSKLVSDSTYRSYPLSKKAKQNFATTPATMFQSSRRIIFGLVTLLAAASTITQVVAVPVASPGGGSGTQSIVIPPDATTSFQKYLHPEDKTSQHVIYGDAKEVEQKLPFLSEKEQKKFFHEKCAQRISVIEKDVTITMANDLLLDEIKNTPASRLEDYQEVFLEKLEIGVLLAGKLKKLSSEAQQRKSQKTQKKKN
ncbi:hypothetical protein EV361DRAFT_936145 [Lentinula raphanica]|nr:hypothetical protein EV361DRAFT_936145 [Lentinula raphanica]